MRSGREGGKRVQKEKMRWGKPAFLNAVAENIPAPPKTPFLTFRKQESLKKEELKCHTERETTKYENIL